MNRFHIEDIIEQDKRGVVYRARDTKSNRPVAVTRFLPFGPGGGGLAKDEAAAFESASERLAGISHVAFRSVVMGSVDPIDGIPYLVTEWVEGQTLAEILAESTLEPEVVIDVLRIALEVSIKLSEALGEEAVWVQTGVESIVVGAEGSGRGFTFWISPYKWLGSDFGARKLTAIAELGEELAGWQKKLVSDQAGSGLGGFIKWLKKNPDARLAEAMEMLATSTRKEEPQAPAEPIQADRTPSPQNIRVKQPSSNKPFLFAAVAALLVIAAGLAFLLKPPGKPQIAKAAIGTKNSPEVPIKDTPVIPPSKETPPKPGDPSPAPKEPIPSEITKNAAETAPVEPKKPQDAASRANELAKRLSEEAAARDRANAALEAAAAAKNPPVVSQPAVEGKVYTPSDRAVFAATKVNTPVKVRGTIRGIAQSSTGKSIYLFFSYPPDPNEICVTIHKNGFPGDFRPETFVPLLGKDVVASGTCYKEPNGRIAAKVISLKEIQPAD